jgi:dTDP-glucose 4,6-dehydratase
LPTKVLLTGTTGFIGSQLAPRLQELNYDVYSLERYVTGRPSSNHGFKTVFADLRDYFQVQRAVKETSAEIIIHLASISPVSYSYENPFEVQEANYMGTVYLAEAALRNLPMLKQFIFASTSETYGNTQTPMSEEKVQLPNSPYSVSKVAAEKYLFYLNHAYKFPVTILRPFNTYGRKKDTHFFIEKTITQMLQSNIVKLGNPDAVRDFLYVDDHVQGYLTALENQDSIGEAINLCTGKPYSLADVIKLAKEITGFNGKIQWRTIPERPLDIKELWGTNAKAKRILNWSPSITLEQGLKLTADYWKKAMVSEVPKS